MTKTDIAPVTTEQIEAWAQKERIYDGKYMAFSQDEVDLGKFTYEKNRDVYLGRTGFGPGMAWESLPPDIKWDWVEVGKAVRDHVLKQVQKPADPDAP